MYVEDVEDVKDGSNTPKGCNAMYIEDVEDGKRTYTHILAYMLICSFPIFDIFDIHSITALRCI